MTSVAIIGHGKTPEGKGWGRNIDTCPTVVRMWNWHWQNLLDYGERYDFGFYEIHPTEMARFYKHNCRQPSRSWIATRLLKPYADRLPIPTEIFDPTPWENLGMTKGGIGMKGRLLLTRGVRAAAWVIVTLRPDTVVLVGFDNVYTGRALKSQEGFPQVYIDCPAAYPMHRYDNVAQTETKSGNHDFAIEGPLLSVLADSAGVKLVHAQDIW